MDRVSKDLGYYLHNGELNGQETGQEIETRFTCSLHNNQYVVPASLYSSCIGYLKETSK